MVPQGRLLPRNQRIWGLDTDSECRFSAANTLSCEVGGSTTTATGFNNQTWYYIAYTWNEATNVAEIWVGTEGSAPTRVTNNTNWTGTVSTKGAGINVNMSPGSAGQIVNGNVSEVRMWNDVRTQAEIQANYAAGTLVGNEAGLIGLYEFNGDYTDKSGNGNAGTAAGTGGAFSTTVPSNEATGSVTRYDGATCASVPTTGWTEGPLNLELIYTDSCGTTGRTTTGTFNWTACNETGHGQRHRPGRDHRADGDHRDAGRHRRQRHAAVVGRRWRHLEQQRDHLHPADLRVRCRDLHRSDHRFLWQHHHLRCRWSKLRHHRRRPCRRPGDPDHSDLRHGLGDQDGVGSGRCGNRSRRA